MGSAETHAIASFLAAGSMSFNPGFALTPSHDGPAGRQRPDSPHRDGTRSGRVEIGTGTAASNLEVFGSLLETRPREHRNPR